MPGREGVGGKGREGGEKRDKRRWKQKEEAGSGDGSAEEGEDVLDRMGGGWRGWEERGGRRQ